MRTKTLGNRTSRSDRFENRVALVVDDDPFIRDVIARMLEKKGFKALAARDGLEGVRMASEAHPDIVLLDLMMPGLDGFAVSERMKFSDDLGDIPVLVITGLGDDASRRYADETAADGYMTKPFEEAELLEKVRATLNRGNVRRGEYPSAFQTHRRAAWLWASGLMAALGAVVALLPGAAAWAKPALFQAWFQDQPALFLFFAPWAAAIAAFLAFAIFRPSPPPGRFAGHR